jgi:predicted transcriptional regulator of viral defense system
MKRASRSGVRYSGFWTAGDNLRKTIGTVTGVPRDRIELSTRGFSVPVLLWPSPRKYKVNRIRGARTAAYLQQPAPQAAVDAGAMVRGHPVRRVLKPFHWRSVRRWLEPVERDKKPSLICFCWYYVSTMTERFRNAVDTFRNNGGILRMSEAVQAGISRRTLYAMHDEGVLERLSRGVYRLASLPSLEAPDLVAVSTRVPNGVICMISALAFHGLTTQIPHAVDIAIARGAEKPRIDYPPVNVYWFSGEAFTSGVETRTIDNKRVRVYGAEKSIADTFKYRNKIGMEVALEALRNWRARRQSNLERLLAYGRVCRVERVIRPYLEAMA